MKFPESNKKISKKETFQVNDTLHNITNQNLLVLSFWSISDKTNVLSEGTKQICFV